MKVITMGRMKGQEVKLSRKKSKDENNIIVLVGKKEIEINKLFVKDK